MAMYGVNRLVCFTNVTVLKISHTKPKIMIVNGFIITLLILIPVSWLNARLSHHHDKHI